MKIAAITALLVLLTWLNIAPLDAANVGAVRVMEAALGVVPGSTRVVPQCGCTIRYLHTRQVGPSVFAVYVQKLD